MRYLEFYVNQEEEGKRVDAILRRHGLSTSAIRRAKHRPHGLLVDGEDIYTSYLVHAGQTVAILADDKAPSGIVPNDGPVDIVYEDDDLLVADKPAGLAVHPCAGSWRPISAGGSRASCLSTAGEPAGCCCAASAGRPPSAPGAACP